MKTENPTPRDKRVLKAHRKRYIEDKDLSTIAQELGKSYDTIRDYFRDDSTERIKQLYDEDELEFLRLQLFQEMKDAKKNAKNYVSKAVSHPEADDKTYLKANKEEQEIPKRFIKCAQELGIFEKPKERKEHIDKGRSDDVLERMQKAYNELEQGENRVEQD